MADTKEFPSRGPKNIKRHRTKFSHPAFNNNNNNNNIYLLQMGCNPVAVVMLRVYKT